MEEKKNNITGKNTPRCLQRLRDISFLLKILHFYAFNIYFNSRPRVLFKRSKYTQCLETILEAEEHVFLIIPKKKTCLKFHSDSFTCDSNPLSLLTPRCIADIYTVECLPGTFPGCIPSFYLMRPRPGSKVSGYK